MIFLSEETRLNVAERALETFPNARDLQQVNNISYDLAFFIIYSGQKETSQRCMDALTKKFQETQNADQKKALLGKFSFILQKEEVWQKKPQLAFTCFDIVAAEAPRSRNIENDKLFTPCLKYVSNSKTVLDRYPDYALKAFKAMGECLSGRKSRQRIDQLTENMAEALRNEQLKEYILYGIPNQRLC